MNKTITLPNMEMSPIGRWAIAIIIMMIIFMTGCAIKQPPKIPFGCVPTKEYYSQFPDGRLQLDSIASVCPRWVYEMVNV